MNNENKSLVNKMVVVFGFLVPVLPIILFLLFYYLPVKSEPYVMSLGGSWEASSGSLITNIKLPGLFPNYGITGFNANIRRAVVLKDSMVGEDLFITIFGTIFQTGLVYVNGSLVGEIGSYGKHRKLGNIQGMDGFFIQKGNLTKTNVIELVLQTDDKQSFGIQDPRFYIGVSRVLKPYFEKNLIINNIFLYGIPFFSLFILVLMAILSINGWNSSYRNKYIATGNYILFTLLFNLFFSGIFISYFLPLGILVVGLDMVIVLFVLVNMEFVQYYYLNRIDRIGIINRFVCILALLSYILNYVTNKNNNDIVNLIYNSFSVYLILSFGYSLYIVIKSVLQSKIVYGAIISFSIFMTIVTAISDLLSNLGIFSFPLVFSVTASSVSIIATIVVIADFIEIGNNNMRLSKTLRKSNDKLRKMIRQVRAKKLMEYDMSMASKIQTALLPQEFPDNEFVRISGGSIPAKMVGGDYFDVIPVGNNSYLCVMADVMGKGMSASLVMVKVQTLLRALISSRLSLVEIANRINEMISGEFKGERFVTLSMVLYDCAGGKAEYAIYGHEPILVWRAGKKSMEVIKNRNYPLGIENKIDMTTNSPFALGPGDRIVLFTDGITEAQDERDEFFGIDQFKEILLERSGDDIRSIFPGLIDRIGRFRGQMEQGDDITLLIMEIKQVFSTK